MSNLQVRDMPPEVHATLKSRAAASGQSLSEYALSILAREAGRPTLDEMVNRVRLRGPVDLTGEAVSLLRGERDDRDERGSAS